MPFASLYGFKKRGEEEEREPETHEEKRARMDARSRQRTADRVCVPPAAAPARRERGDAARTRARRARARSPAPGRARDDSATIIAYQQVFPRRPHCGAGRSRAPLDVATPSPPSPRVSPLTPPSPFPPSRAPSRSRLSTSTITVLPRPRALWTKLRCVMRYWMRMQQARKGTCRTKIREPITNATRAIIETRYRHIVYEGEHPTAAELLVSLEDARSPSASGRGSPAPPGSGRPALGAAPASRDAADASDSPAAGGGPTPAGGDHHSPGSPGSTTTPPRVSFTATRFGPEAMGAPKLALTRHTSKKFLVEHSRSRSAFAQHVPSPGEKEARDGADGAEVEDEDESRVGLALRDRIFLTFNDPEYSNLARYVSFFILTLIMVSTTSFILDTRPEHEGHPALYIIEVGCIIVFTIEYVVKLVTARRRLEFVRQPMNLIDIAAIVPFYIELIIVAASGGNNGNVPTGLLRLFRLFRVFRVLKLGARMRKLEVVAAAVGDSMDMFAMLIFLLLLALVLFSTLIYFCEKGQWEPTDPLDAHAGDPFASIPRSFWWCMVTLMTVGYGDSYPVTIEGKIVASVTMIASVLIMALPISVIGANFTQRWLVYRDNAAAKAREETMVPTFYAFADAFRSHNFVLDEVTRAVEEIEILMEQETGALKNVFEEATEMIVEGKGEEARARRRHLLREFDRRFEGLQDMREELDELLAYANLLSSAAFTNKLEMAVGKNKRMIASMDEVENVLNDVDVLVGKVNELSAKAFNLSPSGSDKGQGTGGGERGRSNGPSPPSFSRNGSRKENSGGGSDGTGPTPPLSRNASGRE